MPTILKVAKALVGHILSEVYVVNHQICTPGEKEVLSFQSLGLQAELPIRMARKLGEEGDHVSMITEPPNNEISPPPRRSKDDHKRKEPDTRRVDYRDEVRSKRSNRETRRRTNDQRPRTPPHWLDLMLPPLNAPIAQVLIEIKNKTFVKWSEKIKTTPLGRNKNKYYEFHRDHSHNTEDYFQLKEHIANMIKKGYLRKFLANLPRLAKL